MMNYLSPTKITVCIHPVVIKKSKPKTKIRLVTIDGKIVDNFIVKNSKEN